MLSEKEINILINENILTTGRSYTLEEIQNLTSDNLFNTIFYFDNKIDYTTYYLSNPKDNLNAEIELNNYIEYTFTDFAICYELECEIENEKILSTPSTPLTVILERLLKQQVEMYKANRLEWDYPSLKIKDLFEVLKLNYEKGLDKILNYNIETKELTFNFSVSSFKKDTVFFNSIIECNRDIFTIMRIEWLKNQIISQEQKVNELTNGIVTTTPPESIPDYSKIKLKWNGSKTQMYFLMRLLKKTGLVNSSYEDIGLFLIQNVDYFEGSDLSTVINEVQKSKYETIPKPKRIDLTGINEVKED